MAKYILSSGLLPPEEEGAQFVFLSPKCLYDDSVRSGIKGRQFAVLKDIWDDKNHLDSACAYLDGIRERLTRKIGSVLNEIHGSDYPQSFWEIVLGQWLIFYTDILYDRYARLSYAIEKYGRGALHFYAVEGGITVRNGGPDFENESVSRLYAAVASLVGIKIIYVSNRRGAKDNQNENRRKSYKETSVNGIKRIAKFGVFSLAGTLLKGRNILINDPSMGLVGQLQMAHKLGGSIFHPALMLDENGPCVKINRERLLDIPADDEFESIAISFLPVVVPEAYLERHQQYVTFAKQYDDYKCYYMKTGYLVSEISAYIYALGRLRGGGAVSAQHGGGYGQAEYLNIEKLQRNSSDYYVTWGWKDNLYKGAILIPLPDPHCSSAAGFSTKAGNYALWIGNAYPVHNYRVYSFNWSDIGIAFDFKDKFLSSLGKNVRAFFIYRPYPQNQGSSETEKRLFAKYPEVKVTGKGNPVSLLAGSKLFVCDYQGTTMLEALAMNVPTVLFWKYEPGRERESVKPLFDLLRDAQILFHDPIQAADHVNKIWEDVDGWWNSAECQNARNKFVDNQARTNPAWKEEWAAALQKIIADSNAFTNKYPGACKVSASG